MHPRMISDAVRGFIDKRSSIPGAAKVVPSPQAEKVHEFFLGMYTSAAEPLPHERYMVKGSVDANIKFDEEFRCSGEELSTAGGHDGDSDDETEVWNPDASMVPSFASFLGGDVGVQKRYLTRATLTSLYWLMLATLADDCDDSKAPSMTTFHAVWHQTWKRVLGFRKSSTCRMQVVLRLPGANAPEPLDRSSTDGIRKGVAAALEGGVPRPTYLLVVSLRFAPLHGCPDDYH